MLSSRINKCDVYIALWLLYNLQSILFGYAGSRIATLVLLVLLCWSVYHMVLYMTNTKPNRFLGAMTILLIMFTFYGVILIVSGKTLVFANSGVVYRNTNYLKNILISFLPVFSFTHFTKKNLLTDSRIVFWAIVFLVAAILIFIHRQNMMIMLSGDEDSEFTNNAGYVILSLFPLVPFLYRRPIIQYSYLAICFVFILMGIKRGAIIIGVICTIWFLYKNMEGITSGKKRRLFLLSVLLLLIGSFFVFRMLRDSSYFNYRLQQTLEGNSSGRDVLYSVFWNHFIDERNILKILFGNGANATLSIAPNFAHCDWLELAINQGILGVILYLIYWVNFIKIWRESDYDRVMYLSLGIIIICFFTESLFSMSYSDMSIYSTVCLGYCIGQLDLRRGKISSDLG